jgi:tRNA1Val (adenine37-N6)-methyltransferase
VRLLIYRLQPVPVLSGVDIMPNPYFQFKQFTVYHDRCAMKVTTDACLFGAWVAEDCQRSTVNDQRLLDIGTGTGLLSLMVVQKNKDIQLDAVEIDKAAAAQATENVKASPYAHNITVHQSDITNWEKGSYDIILSNPPFYEKEIPSTQKGKNVAHHSEGLRLEELFFIIKEKLTDSGSFYLLLPYKRRHDIDKQLQQAGLFLEKKVIVHPAVENAPFRLLLKGGKRPFPTQSESLSIYDTTRAYTPEFVALLKDYYLYL